LRIEARGVGPGRQSRERGGADIHAPATAALDGDNNRIRKNTAGIAPACDGPGVIGLDSTLFTFNVNIYEIRQNETNLTYLAAKTACDWSASATGGSSPTSGSPRRTHGRFSKPSPPRPRPVSCPPPFALAK